MTHRRRAETHDLFEKLDPIHVRHLDVERDDIGIQSLDSLPGFMGIGRLADDLDERVGPQTRGDEAAHRWAVIDDEHADAHDVAGTRARER